MRLNLYKTRRLFALVTCFFFLTSELSLWGQSVTTAPQISAEKPASSPFVVTLPSHLGTVEAMVQGQGPVLFHIQEAHGDHGTQKKIRKILEYLQKEYGVRDVFLEGDAADLHPEFLRFFPEKPEWTREAVTKLFTAGQVSGPALYLALNQTARAYPLEQKELYETNLRVFKEVLHARQKSQTFLNQVDLQIKRLESAYLSADLRRWVSRLEDYQRHQIPLEGWLLELKVMASRNLKVKLESPKAQADWPMLVRVFMLQRFEKEMNQDQFAVERAKFTAALRRMVSPELLRQTEEQLQQPLSRGRLPFPETEIFFEKMVSALPANFDYTQYPQVMRFIGHLILQSELDTQELAVEIDKLQSRISEKLAVLPKEKEMVKLLESYRLLEKLFALELTGEEYKQLEVQTLLKPSELIQKFVRVNSDQKVRNLEIENFETMDALYDKALRFYRLARQRDGVMLGRLEETMAARGITKAAVVTGGFHSQPFQRHFTDKAQNYVLMTPAMKAAGGRETYVQTILKNYNPPELPARATLRLFDEAMTAGKDFPAGWSPEPSRAAMRGAVVDVLTGHQQPIRKQLKRLAFMRESRSEVRSLTDEQKQAAAEAWTLFEASAKKFSGMVPGKTNFELAAESLEDLIERFEKWNSYSEDTVPLSSQLQRQTSLGLNLFFGLMRWIY
ncbi:MAG: hypothetical protein KBC91_05175, partial [Candidatus Omnitrophica bacterium]|nr:hypothetical protein [Candidatus Omnitrophota bacterium]